MNLRTFLIVMSLLPAFALAGTYKWVDKDGTVHYSDKPVQGAAEVDLPEAMIFEAPDVRPPSTPPVPVDETPFSYTKFAFISPKQDQVFWNTAGRVPVQLDIEPRLQRGHAVQLYFNGERVAMNGLGTTLTDVTRGSWTVRAVVVGPDDKEIATTGPITFHVRQHSIAKPP